MAGATRQPQRVSLDKFGNKQIIKSLYTAYNKRADKTYDGIFTGYVELKGQLYKIGVSTHCNKESKHGSPKIWLTVTELKKNGAGGGMSM